MPSSLNALIERNKALGRLRDRIDACLELSIRLALAGQALNKDPLIVRILGDICEQEIATMLAVEAESIDLNIDAQISLGMARIIAGGKHPGFASADDLVSRAHMAGAAQHHDSAGMLALAAALMAASPDERSKRARIARRHYAQSGEAYAKCVAECDALIADPEDPSDG